ncbi:MAG: GNAT family N-acetyltransferase [Flavobacteriia bacterium]
MKLLSSQQINKRKWDQMVASSPQLDFFSLSWVWDVLHTNWEMVCDDAGHYLGPIPMASKFGFSYRLQPFFIRSLNFVPSSDDSFAEIIPFISSSARYVHLNFSEGNGFLSSDVGQFQWLDLSPALEGLRSAYSSNAKRLLKKIPATYRLETLYSPSDFVSFFKQQKGEELIGFTPAVWKRLTDLLDATNQHGHLTVYALKENDEMIAAGAFISFKGTCYFLKGTATSAAKKNGAMYFLLDEVISVIQPTHHTLDFVGSNNEAIAQFYRKFGATNKSYSVLKKNNLPGILKFLKT